MSDGTKPSPEPTMTDQQWGLCAFNLRSTSHKMPMIENYCFKIPAAFPWGQWVNDESMIITWENVSYNRNSERKITGRVYDLFPSLNTLLIALPQMTAFRPFFVAMIPVTFDDSSSLESLRWRHNERDSVSDHQTRDCLLNRLFRRRSKKTSRLRVTGRVKRPVMWKMFSFDDVIMWMGEWFLVTSTSFPLSDNFKWVPPKCVYE